MSTDAADSTRTEPYRFSTTVVLGIEPYQPVPVVPDWANVWRLSALVRALMTKIPGRKPADWEPWLSDVAEDRRMAFASKANAET